MTTIPRAAALAGLCLAALSSAPLAAQAAPTLPEDTLPAYRGTPTPSSEALVPPPTDAAREFGAAPTLPQDTVDAYLFRGFRVDDADAAPRADTAAAGRAPAETRRRDYTLRIRIDTLRVVDGVAEVTIRYDTLWAGGERRRE